MIGGEIVDACQSCKGLHAVRLNEGFSRVRPIAALRHIGKQTVASDVLPREYLEGRDAGLIAAGVGAGADHAVDGVARKAGEGVGDDEGHGAVE